MLRITILRRRLLLLLSFDDDDLADMLFLIEWRKYWSLLYENIPFPQQNMRFDLRFGDISQSDCWDLFRLRKNDLTILFQCLQVPNIIRLEDGCIVLLVVKRLLCSCYRLARPRTYVKAVSIIGRDVTLWCRVCNYMIDHVYYNFHNLVTNNLQYFFILLIFYFQ